MLKRNKRIITAMAAATIITGTFATSADALTQKEFKAKATNYDVALKLASDDEEFSKVREHSNAYKKLVRQAHTEGLIDEQEVSYREKEINKKVKDSEHNFIIESLKNEIKTLKAEITKQVNAQDIKKINAGLKKLKSFIADVTQMPIKDQQALNIVELEKFLRDTKNTHDSMLDTRMDALDISREAVHIKSQNVKVGNNIVPASGSIENDINLKFLAKKLDFAGLEVASGNLGVWDAFGLALNLNEYKNEAVAKGLLAGKQIDRVNKMIELVKNNEVELLKKANGSLPKALDMIFYKNKVKPVEIALENLTVLARLAADTDDVASYKKQLTELAYYINLGKKIGVNPSIVNEAVLAYREVADEVEAGLEKSSLRFVDGAKKVVTPVINPIAPIVDPNDELTVKPEVKVEVKPTIKTPVDKKVVTPTVNPTDDLTLKPEVKVEVKPTAKTPVDKKVVTPTVNPTSDLTVKPEVKVEVKPTAKKTEVKTETIGTVANVNAEAVKAKTEVKKVDKLVKTGSAISTNLLMQIGSTLAVLGTVILRKLKK